MEKFLELLKRRIKMSNPKPELVKTMNDNHNEIKEFEIQGFRDAGKSDGSLEAYKNSIDHFYTQTLLKEKENEEKNRQKKFEIENSIKQAQQKKQVLETELKNLLEKELPEAQKILKNSEEQIHQFIKNPKEFVKEEKDSFMQWIYGLMSLFLASFLYFFYTSVVYSAIFRDVTISKFTIYNSIFYPKAIEEAYTKGIAALMITTLAPFVFYSLGIALDNIKRKMKGKDLKEILKFLTLLVFTFLLDSLFAYHISERIYNSKAINSFDNIKPYSLSDAILDLNFWIIIALGYCVYLLFGHIFGLFNELRTNSSLYDKVKNQLEAEKIRAQEKVKEIESRIDSLNKDRYDLDLKIAELQEEFNKVYYSSIEIKNILAQYTKGWITFLIQGKYPDELMHSIINELNKFYVKIGVDTE